MYPAPCTENVWRAIVCLKKKIAFFPGRIVGILCFHYVENLIKIYHVCVKLTVKYGVCSEWMKEIEFPAIQLTYLCLTIAFELTM